MTGGARLRIDPFCSLIQWRLAMLVDSTAESTGLLHSGQDAPIAARATPWNAWIDTSHITWYAWKRFHGGTMARTLDEVAKHAGGSRSTVSRVINNHPTVSASTRAHVEASIEEHGQSTRPLRK